MNSRQRHHSNFDPVRLAQTVLIDPSALRIGVAHSPEGVRYAVVRIRKNGPPIIIGYGEKIPLLLRLMAPMIARADTGMVPLYMVTGHIGNEDPDAWIDRNEKNIIPPGFTADLVTTEYEPVGDDITAASVVTAALEERIAGITGQGIVPVLLKPVLQGLADAIGHKGVPDTWIAWRIGAQGSVLGRIEHGVVKDVCHFWAGSEALAVDRAGIVDELAQLLRSLGGDIDHIYVRYWAADDAFDSTGIGTIPGCSIAPLPAVDSLPRMYLEAYGNALDAGSALQLLPFHLKQRAESVLRTWKKTMYALRTAAAAAAILLVAAAGHIGISRFILERDRPAMEKVNRLYAEERALSAQRDSFEACIGKSAAFAAGESAITRLLSDLQVVFPEGMQAEEFSVVERDDASWTVTLRIFSRSSGLLQPMLDNLQKVAGISAVRLVYSEQVGEARERKGMRMKIEAIWR